MINDKKKNLRIAPSVIVLVILVLRVSFFLLGVPVFVSGLLCAIPVYFIARTIFPRSKSIIFALCCFMLISAVIALAILYGKLLATPPQPSRKKNRYLP
jgi:Gpi18-like mannosyltransferase